MIKQLIVVCVFVIVGFVSTVSAYFFVNRQQIPLLSPLSMARFSLKNAPSESLVGTITSLSGNVFWLSRVADAPVAIAKPQHIQQGEELQTGDGEVTVAFAKGINVHVFKQTHVAIIQTLPADIVIEQKQGKVSYENAGAAVPLSVRAFDLLLTVHNGQITVTTDTTASHVSMLVTGGSVQAAFTDTQHSSHVMTLSQGESLNFNSKTKTIGN